MSLKVYKIGFFQVSQMLSHFLGSVTLSQREIKGLWAIVSVFKQPALENVSKQEKAKSESRQEQDIYLCELG